MILKIYNTSEDTGYLCYICGRDLSNEDSCWYVDNEREGIPVAEICNNCAKTEEEVRLKYPLIHSIRKL